MKNFKKIKENCVSTERKEKGSKLLLKVCEIKIKRKLKEFKKKH